MFGPNGIELLLYHGAVDVETVALFDLIFTAFCKRFFFFVARPHAQTCLHALPKQAPYRHGLTCRQGGLQGGDLLAQSTDGGF